jgi:hypothetical protein
VEWYDDEGTLLAWFRSLLDGHRMYDEIYSLYGPLYHLVYGLIYIVLHVPLTHTVGRLIFAALWLAYTAGLAMFVHKLTSSIAAALFTYLVTLVWLTLLSGSPGHPVQLCLLLLVAILFLVSAIDRASSGAAWAGLGAAVAGLALVKINVGAYVGSCVLLALLRGSPANTWTIGTARALTAAMLLMPIVVQALLFDFDWVRTYCLFSTLAVLATLIVSKPPARRDTSTHWLAFFLAGGLASVSVVVCMMLEGSSLFAIFNAVVLQNVDFVRNWYVPLRIPQYGVAASMVSVAVALLVRMTAVRPELREQRELWLLILRCGYVVAWATAACFGPLLEFSIVLPFTWLIMLPPPGVNQAHPVARNAAGLIAAMLSLYAFPVAGSQNLVATLLPVALMPVIAHDALVDLQHRAVFRYTTGKLVTRIMIAAVLTFGGFVGVGLTANVARAYLSGVPLDLPGANWIRVGREQADDLHWVTAQLSSCATSYSLPGMLSFAFWARHPLPTTININDVLAFVSPTQQTAIVKELSHLSDLCIVFNPTILKRFDRGQIATNPPLLRYLSNDFAVRAERNGYVILARRSGVQKAPLREAECPKATEQGDPDKGCRSRLGFLFGD